MDQKTMDIDDSYLEQLNAYIAGNVVVPEQYSVPVLATIVQGKRYEQRLTVGEANTNPIIDSRINEL